MYKKIFSLIIISLFLFSLVCVLYTPTVKAYSTETTGLSTYGFDNSQETHALCGGYDIFAFDNELLFFDINAVLQKTFTLPTFSYDGNYFSTVSRTSIISINNSIILVAQDTGYSTYSGGSPSLKNNFAYNIGILNVNTLSYTSIVSTHVAIGSFSGEQTALGGGAYGLGLVLLSNINSTGSFFYVWMSGDIRFTGGSYGVQGAVCNYFAYIGKNVLSGWVSGFSIEQSSVSNSWLYTNALVLTDNMPSNIGFIVCSNSYQGGARAVIYMVNFNTNILSYIGTTGVDYSYTGSHVVGSANYGGFVYLMGVALTSNLIELNIAYGDSTGNRLALGTILFNGTYISQSFVALASLNTPSYMVSPFTVGFSGAMSYGNVSGVYSLGFFDDFVTPWALTGFSATLTGLETGTPVWTTDQVGFLFTPQEPQSFPYASSWYWGGFQPLGGGLGLFVDMLNGYAKANIMSVISSNLAFNGALSGDIYNGALIDRAPIEVSLRQNVQYVYTGNTFISYVLTGSGNYTVYESQISTSPSIFTSYSLTVAQTGNINNGVFQFSIAPTNALQTVYWVMEVVYNSSNNVGAVVYNFGFYAVGGSGDNGVPYPTDNGNNNNGGIIGNGNGSVTSIVTSIFGNIRTDIIFVIFGLICGLLTWKFAMTGLIAGIGISTFLCTMAGLLPIWGVGLCIVLDITLIILGSGLLNKNSNNNNNS